MRCVLQYCFKANKNLYVFKNTAQRVDSCTEDRITLTDMDIGNVFGNFYFHSTCDGKIASSRAIKGHNLSSLGSSPCSRCRG